VLLPTLLLFATGAPQRHRAVLGVACLVLLAASVAAGSRGGWLALAAGGAIGVLLARRSSLRIEWKLGWVLLAAAIVTALAGALVQHEPQNALTASLDARSTISRFDLYHLAVAGISVASLPLGSGYLSFYYLLEAARGSIADYQGSITYFVHNDYLQTVLELGAAGLAGLLAVVVLPQIGAWRAARAQRTGHPRLVAALAAALASMAVHALVDFPFYVPLCLAMYGIAAGLLDSLCTAEEGVRLPRMLKAAVAALGIWVLAMPAAAQVSAGYAHRQWRDAQPQSAAYWFEVARRVEPRDWRYHWYAGQFWYAQAMEAHKPEAAHLADAAFAAGDAANPREVRNLLGRIAVHTRLRTLLAAPVDAGILAAWCDRAVMLAPMDPQVKAEVAFVETRFGRAPREGRR
jgi:hypothetical protein